ncbi:probable trehalose-phosphate phosphatase 1 [Rutidosis leptorrhynchoides]|uniref:probable trehalose-phosphate phosphatase 1 n=1 Tax=Rutidosis leptorrhynchoides TaxID=125765 RepID=UPI003A99962D
MCKCQHDIFFQVRVAVPNVSICFPTVIISDGNREKVYDFVKLDTLYYFGSHGMDTIRRAQKNNSYDKIYQQRRFDNEITCSKLISHSSLDGSDGLRRSFPTKIEKAISHQDVDSLSV